MGERGGKFGSEIQETIKGVGVSKLRNPTPRLLMFLDFEGFKTNRCEECRCCMRMVCEIVAFLGQFWGSVEYIDACELECGGYVTSHKRSRANAVPKYQIRLS